MKYLNLDKATLERQLDQIAEKLVDRKTHPLERRLLQEDRREFMKELVKLK